MPERLIANSGIQFLTFDLNLSEQDGFKMWFHEYYDTENTRWNLDLVHEVRTEDYPLYYYKKKELYDKGYLVDTNAEILPEDLREDDITPLREDEEMKVDGSVYRLTFSDKHNELDKLKNKWLPLPYFHERADDRFKFSPLNWCRMKLIPKGNKNSYDVVLAFDTRAGYEDTKYHEYPVFPDRYSKEMSFSLCRNEFLLMDFCSPNKDWSYVDDYIFKLVHPDLTNVSQIRGRDERRMSYIASYIFLINYLAQKRLFPSVELYKDQDVEIKNIDMVIDIGNSRTTALLIENNANFNQVVPLRLVDYTNLLEKKDDCVDIRVYDEPFDMRLAFRSVDFGSFGIVGSKQFVYPSFVRLGQEANYLIHKAANSLDEDSTLSTYSSPKRYLWDNRASTKEWKFLILEGEKSNHILDIPGLSSFIKSDGKIDESGAGGGRIYHYSRRSLMTFAFLEMITQAHSQINSQKYRTSMGDITLPRKVRKIIVTCPTAMSKIEREALVRCAEDAVILHNKFTYFENPVSIEVIPTMPSMRDEEGYWYYDEATCSQLVYIYGEIGYKYKGICSEFFNLYGKKLSENSNPTLTVGSLDIGAGTTDLMISEYSYERGETTTITPNPKFYDSFYFAGDDVLKALIKNVMLLDEKHSAFRKALSTVALENYRQKIKDFFGPDYNGQTILARNMRKNFNIQYSIPLMSYFLKLSSEGSPNCSVKFEDVFKENQPSNYVVDYFKREVGIDITTLTWNYDKEFVEHVITKEFEPLLEKIAAMFYSYSCDIILLSGRPASLPAIRNIFLKYYSISPNRLISLNNYYVGGWYPFTNNTGYITNPKTIVAMGGVIGHYASDYANLNNFIINLEMLRNNLKSTINYVEASRDGRPIEYLITPEKSQGVLTITTIPTMLNVRQIDLESYPLRTLYSIDFNRTKIINKMRNKGNNLSDEAIQAAVNEELGRYRKRMPFTITIERSIDNKEELSIVSILDRNKEELHDTLDIHIQSLGAEENYWLDSGVFNF